MASLSGTRACSNRALPITNVNPNLCKMKYAVRGELAIRAEKYRLQLAEQTSRSSPSSSTHSSTSPPAAATSTQEKLPFESVIFANIGNPQQLDQKPLTFFRQVTSLLENPVLLSSKSVLVSQLGYKEDVIERAQTLLSEVRSVGAYSSQSQGSPLIRKSVAEFIQERDGYPADWNHIFLTGGASAGVTAMMHTICADPNVGVLVPTPQYPLYTATLALLNARHVQYYLEESTNWGTDLSEIKSSLTEARSKGTDVRAIVIINPGNPTGACLNDDQIRKLLKFARQEKLVVLADEVYQTNVFIGKFVSFKKVLQDLRKEEPGQYDTVELVSLHSVSKGMVGECGHRAGYMELCGFEQAVVDEISKYLSVQLCPPVIGQCILEMMVNPPKNGDPSYPLYRQEYDGVYKSLRERAYALWETFKKMEGVDCQEPAGAMYLFPTIKLPPKAIEKAESLGKSPDLYYCLRLLDATGICLVQGNGFGQRPGTYHFRTTFLAPGTEWSSRITGFHAQFMKEFS